jgi:hypothetical protein
VRKARVCTSCMKAGKSAPKIAHRPIISKKHRKGPRMGAFLMSMLSVGAKAL